MAAIETAKCPDYETFKKKVLAINDLLAKGGEKLESSNVIQFVQNNQQWIAQAKQKNDREVLKIEETFKSLSRDDPNMQQAQAFMEKVKAKKKAKEASTQKPEEEPPKNISDASSQFLEQEEQFAVRSIDSSKIKKMSYEEMVEKMNRDHLPLSALGLSRDEIDHFLKESGDSIDYLDFSNLSLGVSNFSEREVIAYIGYCPHVKTISMAGVNLDEEGIEQLAQLDHAKGVETLNLQRCAIGDSEAKTLAKAKGFKSLKKLELMNNFISKEGKQALEEAFPGAEIDLGE